MILLIFALFGFCNSLFLKHYVWTSFLCFLCVFFYYFSLPLFFLSGRFLLFYFPERNVWSPLLCVLRVHFIFLYFRLFLYSSLSHAAVFFLFCYYFFFNNRQQFIFTAHSITISLLPGTLSTALGV